MIKMKDSRLLPSSYKICDYIRFKQKLNNVTIKDLVKAVRPPHTHNQVLDTITNLLEKDFLPLYYDYFLRICNAVGVEEEMVEKWGREDPAFIFAYFNNLNPNAPDIEYLSVLIRERDRKYSIYEVSAGTGLTNSSISRIELMQNGISYASFIKFCDFYGEDPVDILAELASYPESVKAVKKITNLILNALDREEIRKEQAHEILNMSENKFDKLLYGKTRFTASDIRIISRKLYVSAETLYEFIYEACLNDENRDYKEATKKGLIPQGEQIVTRLTDEILKYARITDMESLSSETHTVLTLIYLILLSGGTDKYRAEISYYLDHLFDDGDLYREFVKIKDVSWNNLDGIRLFEALLDYRKISHLQLGEMVGVSNSHTIRVCQRKGIQLCPTLIARISDAAQISPVVLLEGYLSNERAEQEEVSVWGIIQEINSYIIWNMDKETIRTNTLSEIFNILFNKNFSAKKKYKELKKLKYD